MEYVKFMVNKSKYNGFTLVELLIVIVIIGLLGSLVAPQMFSKIGSSKQSTAKAQMQMFETALDTYFLDVGEYPKNLNELRSSAAPGWDGPYIKKDIPLDPWNNPYQLSVPGPNGEAYVIQSLGKDGKTGGEGEDSDLNVSG